MTLSFRTRLLAVTVLVITASVASVALLVGYAARSEFENTNVERTAALVAQFQQQCQSSAESIARTVTEIASSDPVQRLAIEARGPGDLSGYVHEAEPLAATRHLDFMEFTREDCTIVSSAHWPARFGYKELWLTEDQPGQASDTRATLRTLETPAGTALALISVRRVGDLYVVGGRRLDAAFLHSLALPSEMRVLLYSYADNRLEGDNTDLDAGKVKPSLEELLESQAEHRPAEITQQVQWTSDPASRESLHLIPLHDTRGRLAAALIVGASQRTQLELERRIRNTAIVVALFAILAGAVFSWLLAPRVSGPVEKLAPV